MTCEHFGSCGGCVYLDIPYDKELAIKLQDLKKCLGEYGGLLETIIPAPKPANYRNKMEFAFGDDKKCGSLSLGIRKKRSMYEVAQPTNCVLVPAYFTEIIKTVQEYFLDSGEKFYHRKKHTGTLRHLTIRRGEFTGETLVMLSTTSHISAPLEPLARLLCRIPANIVGILHATNDSVADVVKNDNIKILHGRDYYKELLLGHSFDVAINAFFQTNSTGAEALYSIVKDFAKNAASNDMALDLYCGTGTITQIIAPLFKKIAGIEIIPEAIEKARQTAASNCEFFEGDAAKLLEQNYFMQNKPNLIVLDPPRDGLNPKIIPHIHKLQPEKIIYVSCKPTSLARDMPLLQNYGYNPVAIKALDMFPRTPHVETIVLLQWGDS